MANEEQLVALDNVGELETLTVDRGGDESPSLFLVIEDCGNIKKEEEINETPKEAAADDFEFRTIGGGGGFLLKTEEPTDMCAADEVFFKGQILPLRPSSDISCLVIPANWGPISRSGSQAEPMDRCSSTATSTGFTSRSGSSSSSSSGSGINISRSHSSSSHSSVGGDAAPRLSLSNNFYAHPSPTPQVRHTKRASTTAARKSTGSMPPGWGLIRLGVVKAPEIDLFDPRPQRVSSGIVGGAAPINRRSRSSDHNHQESKQAVKKASDDKTCVAANNSKSSDGIHATKQKRAIRFLGMGMGCKGSPDGVVVDANAAAAASSGMLMGRRKKEGVRRGGNMINV